MERLQKTIEEQRAQAPPPPAKPSSPGKPSVSPPRRDVLAEQEEDQLWAQFERADLEGKVTLFLRSLEAGELDDEYAFEMLSEMRSQLDLSGPQARARYAELVERLRQQAPDLYEESIHYYHEDLIYDAVTDGRWEALPELLTPFAEDPDLDLFSMVIDRLMYHGQIQPLIETMAQAWSKISESANLLPWAIDEFGGRLMHLNLLHYLETSENARPDDSLLLETTTAYGEWKEGWLERFVPHLTSPAPSAWQPADFDETVDADQWHDNLNDLLAEFVADQHRAGIPYGRGYMAWAQLAEALEQQFVAPSAPSSRRGKGSRKGKGKKRGAKTQSARPSSSLVPRYQTTDKALVDLPPFLEAQPYRAAATLELLPAYLYFLAHLGLVHPTEMDEALAELQPLKEHAPRAIASYGADPRAVDTVAAAWSDEALDALRNDPALVDTRATPPVPPSPASEQPSPRPGALLTYTFKVTYLEDPDVWRVIEISANQTLNDLHHAIRRAVDFDDDHLYSYYMSGRAWDRDTEYASPRGEGPSAARANIGDLNLRMKQRFMYLFDYGDEHRFEVRLLGIDPDAPKEKYPRVVEQHGKNPPQYEGWDEDEEWEDEP